MRTLISFIAAIVGLNIALALAPDCLCEADLLFSAPRVGNHITEVTARDSVAIDHVAIFHRIGGNGGLPCVIEATPRGGVRVTPLDSFLVSHTGDSIIAARVSCEFSATTTIRRALSFTGRPYDVYFTSSADSIYCSELVLLSYRDLSGKPLFHPIPMTFRDANGRIPDFWMRHYSAIGQDVPEGEPGSNPAALFSDSLIQVISY